MTEENRTYITHLKVTDVPWHRLTTAYGRGTDFPAHLAVLEQMRDLAFVKESLYELTTNMEHQGTLWHATPFGMVFLSRILGKALKERPESCGPFPGRGAAGLLCLHPPVLPRWG
ncbi:hypothetical protein [Oscillibacter sp.]|uniref:hypothetical protein n=1 Tax=Oscillibacter sp. TaxID=1945593 RepID=UPI00338F2339